MTWTAAVLVDVLNNNNIYSVSFDGDVVWLVYVTKHSSSLLKKKKRIDEDDVRRQASWN